MDHDDKRSVQGDVDRTNRLIKRRELKWGHSKCVHTNKEGPTGQGGGDRCLTFSGKSASQVPVDQCTQHGAQAGGIRGLCAVTRL